MTTFIADSGRDTKPVKQQRDARLSPDRKWRSFSKVPNLVQYVPTGTYFGRVKIQGKIFRETLETDVFTTAKLKLPDFLKNKRKEAARPVVGTFAAARTLYESEIEADHTLKETSKLYRRKCIKALLKSWPDLDGLNPAKISEGQCRAWASRYAAAYSASVFNNSLGTLRLIFERAGISHDDNPALKIKRLGIKPKELKLPEPEQFDAILSAIESSGAGKARNCADFVRFLAFSGCRLSEARQVTWADADMQRSEIKIVNAKRSKTGNHHPFRFVPMIPPMRQLLEKMRSRNQHAPTDRVCVFGECEKSLTRACKLVGISRITHHDLRHLFATRCIEAGVDIPTVARWLGHVDGGALAMRVYGHLRRTHSQAQAQLVTFGSSIKPVAVVPQSESGDPKHNNL